MRKLSELIELLMLLIIWVVNLAFGAAIWAIIGLLMIAPLAVIVLIVKHALGV